MRVDDTNCISRLKKGKEDALEYVVDQYLPLVKGIAAKVLGPLGGQGMIEECVNDIFFSVWKHTRQFEGTDLREFRKWLCGVSRYRAIDFYRKEQRRRAVEAPGDIERLVFEASFKPECQSDFNVEQSAEDVVLFYEDKAEAMKLLELLEPVDQQIFLMKFFLGMKSEEISEALGLTKSSVDNRIYRGKKKLLLRAQSAAV